MNQLSSHHHAFPVIEIKTLSAPCGAGKTEALIVHIERTLGSTNTLLVLQTLELCEEVGQRLRDRGIPFTSLNHENCTNVGAAVSDFIKNAFDVGTVLIITLTTYLAMRWFEKRENWQIAIDEVPQVDKLHPFSFPRNRDALLKHVTTRPCQFPGVYQVVPRSKDRMIDLLEDRQDTVDETFRDLFTRLVSDNYDIFIDANAWDEFVGLHTHSGDDACMIFMISMLRATPFKGVILLGAFVERSLLHRWLTILHGDRVCFKEMEEMASALRYRKHDFGDRLRLYSFPVKRFTKRFRDEIGPDGRLNGAVMDEVVLEHFGEQEFGYVPNNRWKPKGFKHATRISVKCHGQNRWQHLTRMYLCAALVRKPPQIHLLKKLGLTDDDLLLDACDDNYQQLMRSDLRDSSSTKVVEGIISDHRVAEELQRRLGVHKILSIGETKLATKKRLSQVQKNKRSELMKEYRSFMSGMLPKPLSCNGNGNRLFVTLPASLYAKDPDEFRTLGFQVSDFVQRMERISKIPVNKKKDWKLFNSGVYGDNPTTTYRKLTNLQTTSFLFLDFDDGKLSKEDFVSTFGDRLSFLICNSHSRSPTKPNKFRVMVFFLNPATHDQHRACHDYVLAVLEEAGWEKDDLALDPQSRNPNALFFLPCTNSQYPDHWFFEAYNTDADGYTNHALDPTKMPDVQPAPEIKVPVNVTVRSGDIPQDRINQIVNPLRGLKNGRDKAYRDAALKLASLRHGSLRLAEWEIENALMAVADTRALQDKVQRLMSWLKDKGKL